MTCVTTDQWKNTNLQPLYKIKHEKSLLSINEQEEKKEMLQLKVNIDCSFSQNNIEIQESLLLK